MKEFYYQLKTKEKSSQGEYGISFWSNAFFKGIIEAETGKKAREIIKNHILDKNIKKGDDILLSVLEITEDRKYLKDFFVIRTCKYCGQTYTNAHNEFNYGEFCCRTCYEQYTLKDRLENQEVFFASDFYSSYPVIYRIYDKKNNKNYVGQTIRSFTLRWWEHYKSWIHCLKDTEITDFEFSILAVFDKSISKEDLTKKEQHWIEHYNCIENGYNTVNAKTNKDD